MRFALINPNWTFDGSVYFGCRQAHLPLELGYSRALLEGQGHETLFIDAQMENLSLYDLRRKVGSFMPDFTVIPTAPSYLFWRCAPPELKVPRDTVLALEGLAGVIIITGPHSTVTPGAALKKTGAAIAVLGECEGVVASIAGQNGKDWRGLPSIAYVKDGALTVNGRPCPTDMASLPPLFWDEDYLRLHTHHHHRFDAMPSGPGAEMETSRGCPYSCSFCLKDGFRERYRKRPLETTIEELDGLIRSGAEYVYFIDEIFMPDRILLEELAKREVRFGIQTRIDLWRPELLDLLGPAGCVSLEAGVESVTERGRRLLHKRCSMSTAELFNLLIHARRSIPFVQATLMASVADDEEEIERCRQYLHDFGVWANKPVPLFPYPGSREYKQRWGPPGEDAWEKAHGFYLRSYSAFSDIQDGRPLDLAELERR